MWGVCPIAGPRLDYRTSNRDLEWKRLSFQQLCAKTANKRKTTT